MPEDKLVTSYRSLQEALTRGLGRERSFLCPVHDDRHASASVNVAKGVWVCYTCAAHGSVDGVIETDDDHFMSDIEDLLGGELHTYTERWLDQFDVGPVHPYWLSRFSEAACRHFRLGYDHQRTIHGVHMPSPCYPMRDATGTVLGVVYRNLKTDPKYLYPSGVVKSALLFNYSPAARTSVVLVEGAMDAVACWEVGHQAFALYGSTLHPSQIRLLCRTGVMRVVLAMDNDKAGERAVAGWRTDDGIYVPGIAHKLNRAGIETVSVGWDGHDMKDIAEANQATRKILLDPLAL